MFRKKKKNKIIHKIFFSQITLTIIGLFILSAISYPLAKKATQQYKINQEVKDLQKEINKLENKTAKLNNLIKYVNSDDFVQETARLNLNLKKKGEKVAVIQNEDSPKNSANSAGVGDLFNDYVKNNNSLVQKQTQESNPEKWWRYFFTQ